MRNDDFFKDFERGAKRSLIKNGIAVMLVNMVVFLFTVAVIVGAIYVVAHYVL